jgi:hypothetical protein
MRTMTLAPWLGAAGLAALGLACGHTETRAVTFDQASPSAGGVTVLDSRAPTGGEELGTVRVRGGEGVRGSDVRKLYSDLVRQARDLGGNAVVIESIGAGAKGGALVPPARPCDPDCPDLAPAPDDEPARIELRGKVLRLSPEELKGAEPSRRVP